jgi:hypothetical protein
MSKELNQKQVILNHLKKYGSITGAEAWDKYHIYRLSDVIFKLRKTHDIDTVNRVGSNDYGNYNFADYVYKGELENV